MHDPRYSVVVDGVDGRPLAGADIDVVHPSVARASLYVEAGHLPMGTRTRLVDAVFDSPQICTHQYLQVIMPLGDTEILDRVRERSDAGEARAAGSTCLFYAVLAAGQVPNKTEDELLAQTEAPWPVPQK